MQLKPLNLFLITIALFLGATVYALNHRQQNPTRVQSASSSQRLFQFDERQVQTLEVTTPVRSLMVIKDDNGLWQLVEPEVALANQASVAYLANLLASQPSDRTLTISSDDLSTYGLNQPLATLRVTAEGDRSHTLVLGTYNFNRTALYALVDPPEDLLRDVSPRPRANAVDESVDAEGEPEVSTDADIETESTNDADENTSANVNDDLAVDVDTDAVEESNGDADDPTDDATSVEVERETDENRELSLVLVSLDFETAVTRPLSSWKEDESGDAGQTPAEPNADGSEIDPDAAPEDVPE
ncbi:MAG: DUF4340 domain-containing protein [Kaiparowitsia implicata GSE-PSE-MK54-09C]|jgi:hypothetical protein|nr:DUF4340 domain-containing protein [Kaiparowitsia implicata GSE-PSE-MK54-09C]